MSYSFHPEAEIDFQDAVYYYDECESGLGDEFDLELQATINRIVNHPDAWREFSHRTRRCLCNRFPYSVVYRPTETEITIYAVAHHSRKPGYWKERMR